MLIDEMSLVKFGTNIILFTGEAENSFGLFLLLNSQKCCSIIDKFLGSICKDIHKYEKYLYKV